MVKKKKNATCKNKKVLLRKLAKRGTYFVLQNKPQKNNKLLNTLYFLKLKLLNWYAFVKKTLIIFFFY